MQYKETQLTDGNNIPLMPITTENQVLVEGGTTIKEALAAKQTMLTADSGIAISADNKISSINRSNCLFNTCFGLYETLDDLKPNWTLEGSAMIEKFEGAADNQFILLRDTNTTLTCSVVPSNSQNEFPYELTILFRPYYESGGSIGYQRKTFLFNQANEEVIINQEAGFKAVITQNNHLVLTLPQGEGDLKGIRLQNVTLNLRGETDNYERSLRQWLAANYQSKNDGIGGYHIANIEEGGWQIKYGYTVFDGSNCIITDIKPFTEVNFDRDFEFEFEGTNFEASTGYGRQNPSAFSVNTNGYSNNNDCPAPSFAFGGNYVDSWGAPGVVAYGHGNGDMKIGTTLFDLSDTVYTVKAKRINKILTMDILQNNEKVNSITIDYNNIETRNTIPIWIACYSNWWDRTTIIGYSNFTMNYFRFKWLDEE